MKLLNNERAGIGLFLNEERCYDVNKSGQVERGLNIYTNWSTNYGLQGLMPMQILKFSHRFWLLTLKNSLASVFLIMSIVFYPFRFLKDRISEITHGQ